ncbi:MAG: MarC family protein [Chloroflexi bacterium]|nr:MarC family protein [Chloroflexota bacterium]
MNNPPLQFGLLCFVSLFTIIDPIGALPVFGSMTTELSHEESRRVALRAAITAWVVLIFFALTGRFLFDFFGISVNSLRIVGGVIFFIMGYEMLGARLTRTRLDKQSVTDYINDIAITPLGIPLIAGPGAIATVIVLMNETGGEMEKEIALVIALSAVLLLMFLFLIGARQVVRVLGHSGNQVLLRIMGLIVMAIAVEFFVNGLRPIVQSMR